MIRKDFLLRMVEQCVQALIRSLSLAQQGKIDQARTEVDLGMQTVANLSLDQVRRVSEAELMAILLTGEATQSLGQKCMLLVALLQRAGDLDASQGNLQESRACYLKALNLQLAVLIREGAFAFPEFVPRLETLLETLKGEPLPIQTNAALMQHYERLGQFAKAEDALFSMLEMQPSHDGLVELGLRFYQRLLGQQDETLELGNLPRAEVQSGLAELRARVSA